MSSKETQDHDGRASYAHLRNHSAEQSGESEHRSHVSVVTLKADKDAALQNVQSGQRDYKALSLMKYVSLVLLTLQNAALILVMRYVRTRPGDMFMATTAVIMAEIFKLVVCIIIVIFQEKGVGNMLRHLNGTIVQQPLDCLKISVPAIIYMIQNNLLYVALSNLEATTFQITYQIKILTTALFSVAMLRKRLSPMQWVSLVLLFIGVAVVQLDSAEPARSSGPSPGHASTDNLITKPSTIGDQATMGNPAAADLLAPMQNYLLGLSVVLLAACMSGYAGIYFERLLKQTSQSLSVRNVQLCFVGIVCGVVGMVVNDGAKVLEKGFLFGYDPIVWLVIILNSIGGLITALVVRYADNILKGFATSCSIILSCVLSVTFFSSDLTLLFSGGAFLVVLSVFLYSKYQPVPVKPAVVNKSKDD